MIQLMLHCCETELKPDKKTTYIDKFLTRTTGAWEGWVRGERGGSPILLLPSSTTTLMDWAKKKPLGSEP